MGSVIELTRDEFATILVPYLLKQVNHTAASILQDVLNKDEARARATYRWDGDKLGPDLRKIVESYLGCRTHFVIGCEKFPCHISNNHDLHVVK